MFFITRFILELFSPFSFSLAILISGVLLIAFGKRRAGLALQIAGIGILVVLGYGVGTRGQLEKLEAQYLPFNVDRISADLKKQIQYVVVLGAGHVSDSSLPVTSQIGCASLYRLVEGIRISQVLPNTHLIISGGVGYDPVPNANIVAEVAGILKGNNASVLIENRPRDTMEEAQLLQSILAKKPFVLVTSAAHMPRAMEIFAERGMAPVAAPTDFMLKRHVNPPAGLLFPSADNLILAKKIFYEWIGTVWTKIKKNTEKYL